MGRGEVLVLGVGYTGRRVALLAQARRRDVRCVVRSETRAEALRREGLEVLRFDVFTPELLAPHVTADTHVVVCFPPDGTTDASLAPSLSGAGAISYVSSTGVYGDVRGHIDDATPLPDAKSPGASRILEAERAWRAASGTVLRCAGIYGPERGLHHRVVSGQHRVPGDGSRSTSRIHVDDLAELLLASAKVHGETFVVGDREPGTQAEVVGFLCRHFGVPYPPSVPLEEVHETLRGDRRIDGSRALAVLGVTLRYPTYREGMTTLVRAG